MSRNDLTGQCVKCDDLGHETSEHDAMVEKSKKGSLDWSPKSNWVEEEGGLPKYTEEVALALMRDHGYSRQKAIAIARSRVRMWAAGGGDVDPKTRIKAVKDEAQWQGMRARRKGKS